MVEHGRKTSGKKDSPSELPSRVTVGGHQLDVLLVERVDRENSEGAMSTQKGYILLKDDLGARSWHVFLHEVLHAIDEVYNDAKLSERSVEHISQGLYQVARDLGWIR